MSGGRTLWRKAADFAARAHRNQMRRDGSTPYVSHAFRVAMTVRHVFNCDDETILAAALLHDVIEDCDVDYDEILDAFGKDVADLVSVLSKDKRLIEEEREREYDERLRSGSWKAILIKLADVCENYLDAVAGDRALAPMLSKIRRALALAEGIEELNHARRFVRTVLEGSAAPEKPRQSVASHHG